MHNTLEGRELGKIVIKQKQPPGDLVEVSLSRFPEPDKAPILNPVK